MTATSVPTITTKPELPAWAWLLLFAVVYTLIVHNADEAYEWADPVWWVTHLPFVLEAIVVVLLFTFVPILAVIGLLIVGELAAKGVGRLFRRG